MARNDRATDWADEGRSRRALEDGGALQEPHDVLRIKAAGGADGRVYLEGRATGRVGELLVSAVVLGFAAWLWAQSGQAWPSLSLTAAWFAVLRGAHQALPPRRPRRSGTGRSLRGR